MADATLDRPRESLTRSLVELGSWTCCAQPAGAIEHPDQLAGADWMPARVPGTAAAALAAAGRWDWNQPIDVDAHDWWFRTSFDIPDAVAPSSRAAHHLCLDGLATLAEVWLNGRLLLTSDNMFRAYRLDVTTDLQAHNELVLGFRSIGRELQRKRPRPRWKPRLVSHQQLRWLRTSLLGRMPGWSPVAAAVGPWRPVRLERGEALLSDMAVATGLDGATGVVAFRAQLHAAARPECVVFRAGGCEAELECAPTDGGWDLHGEVRIENAPLWWPHTHGPQPLVACELLIEFAEAAQRYDCGRVGFRRVDVDTQDGFAIRMNGEPVFCRGACWTIGDLLSHGSDETSLRRDLTLARDAGANMLRVGGTMVYESDRFYELCDDLGILVWQDFMFANMDYPVDDPGFRENITKEAIGQLARLARHPCLAMYCGNSEVEQQAAMLGLPRDVWTNPWFSETLPQLCATHHPGVPYVPSTPTGGALPFQPRQGLAHYYGVGAYRRPLADVRNADVKFSPECLGFANMPEDQTIWQLTGGNTPAVHDPGWKRRVPRDAGAGWDFEDIRDHYLCELYGIDPLELRACDMPRYLQLSRVATGEVMARVFAEWRSGHSRNRGSLVWFYKDLWPGAGWGILDSIGFPKAAYYYLKRTWRSRQLVITDEATNGLDLHLVNETADAASGRLELVLLREPELVIARGELEFTLPGRASRSFSADDLLGTFRDVNYAYRFGPQQHDTVIATWHGPQRQVVSEAFYFIGNRQPRLLHSPRLELSATRVSDTEFTLRLRSDSFLHAVSLQAKGLLPDDNYFHLPPGRERDICLRAIDGAACGLNVQIGALNLDEAVTIKL